MVNGELSGRGMKNESRKPERHAPRKGFFYSPSPNTPQLPAFVVAVATKAE